MRTSTIVIWVIIIVLVVLGIWWYVSSQNTAPSQAPNIPATTQTTSNATSLGESTSPTLGNYLVAQNGMTLYMYSKDGVGTSTCYGECATVWPPYTVAAGTDLAAPAGATGTVATITRTDGTMQVVYNGMPLYYYAQDVNPGDTNGQGVGGTWSVMTP